MKGARVGLRWAVVLLDADALGRARAALGAAGVSDTIHRALALAAGRPQGAARPTRRRAASGGRATARAPSSASRASGAG